MPPTYYEILGVAASATQEEIKAAYRSAAMKWHPDRHKDAEAKATAQKRFQAINAAYMILRDAELRARYDEQLRATREEQRAHQSTEQDQRRAEQEQASEAPGQDEELFFREMLAMAFELADKGFAETRIREILTKMGCPPALAAAVAEFPFKKAPYNAASSKPTKAPKKRVQDMSWEEAEPYYAAYLRGKDDRVLSDDEYEGVRSNRGRRIKRASIMTAIIFVLIVAFAKIHPEFSVWHLMILVIIFLLLGSIVLATADARTAFGKERKFRKEIAIFKKYHHGGTVFSIEAFIASFLLLGYRKLYFSLVIFLAFLLILGMIAPDMGEGASTAAGWGIAAGLGAVYNKLWFNKARRQINKDLKLGANEAVARLRAQSQVSVFGLLVAVSIAILLIVAAMIDAEKKPATSLGSESVIQDTGYGFGVRTQQPHPQPQPTRAETPAEWDAAVARLERIYPVLNPDSPDFDSRWLDWMVERVKWHTQQGHSRIEALALSEQDFKQQLQGASAR